MHITHLRKVGGSIMLAVPPAMLDMLHLNIGATVSIEAFNGRLIIEPQQLPRYTLDGLLAQCDPHAPISEDDVEWVNAKPIGREL